VTDTVADEPPFSVYVKLSDPQKFAAGVYVNPLPPPVIATVPPDPSVFAVIDFGPPSGSVSFANTSIAVAAASSVRVAASSTAVGGVSAGAGGVVVGGTVVEPVVDVVPVEVEPLVDVPVVVVAVPVVDVPVVVVVVVGGATNGTRTSALKRLRIVSGGSARSTSWIRPA
jgi:hypothetical protein